MTDLQLREIERRLDNSYNEQKRRIAVDRGTLEAQRQINEALAVREKKTRKVEKNLLKGEQSFFEAMCGVQPERSKEIAAGYLTRLRG